MAKTFKQRVLGRIQGSVTLTCLAFAADNLLASSKVTAADPAPDEHLSGSDLAADAAYARLVSEIYRRAGPVEGRVAEVGPGGSAAVALYLVAGGCAEVDLVDRFVFGHDPAAQARLYRHIIGAEPALQKLALDPERLAPRITHYTGEHAAAEVFFRQHKGYDAILSCAVLEHLYDPLGALEAMASALKPGGRLIHQVDLRDHGMFTAAGHNELTFLGIPSWFYPHMSRRRGRPNRVTFDRYRQQLDRLGLDYELLTTHLVSVGPIKPARYEDIPAAQREQAEAYVERYRKKLAREFRDIATRDLAVSSFFMSARRS